MAKTLAEFLAGVGPEFDGKALDIGEAFGSHKLDDILEHVDIRDDLSDLDKSGLKKLYVNKLFKAIMNEKERRGCQQPSAPFVPPARAVAAAAAAAAPTVATVAEATAAVAGEPAAPGRPKAAAQAAVAAAGSPVATPSSDAPAEGGAEEEHHGGAGGDAQEGGGGGAATGVAATKGPVISNMLERACSAIQENEEKTPKAYVNVSNVARHTKKPAPLAKDCVGQDYEQEYPSLGPAGARPAPAWGVQQKKADDRTPQGGGGGGAGAAAPGGGADEEEHPVDPANEDVSRMIIDQKVGWFQGHELKQEQFDRMVEFDWDRKVWAKGRFTDEDSPISVLSFEEFKSEFLASLAAFAKANPDAEWQSGPPELEAFVAYEANPTGNKRGYARSLRPHVVVLFARAKDAEVVHDIYRGRQITRATLLDVKGQQLFAQKPNRLYVKQIVSSAGSAVPSDAQSRAGSTSSHSSQPGAQPKNMTMLFEGIPEAVYGSESRKKEAKDVIEEFAGKVCAALPSEMKMYYAYSASYTHPSRAPPGGCLLTFWYTVQGRKIDPDKNRAYTFETFKDMYRGKDEKEIVRRWEGCEDAVRKVERMLGGEKPPMSIARWFFEEVERRWSDPPPPGGAAGAARRAPLGGSEMPALGRESLTMQWSRRR